VDHLSRILTKCTDDLVGFSNHFPDEQLFVVSHTPLPWFAHIANYLATRKIPSRWYKQEKDRFFSRVRYYYWEDPYLFKHCPDQVVCRFVSESEIHSILTLCHSYACGGHFRGHRTAAKVLQSGFFWPTLFRDAHRFCLACERCQRMGVMPVVI